MSSNQALDQVLNQLKFRNIDVQLEEKDDIHFTGAIDKKKFSIHVQYDWMSERTNQLAIESGKITAKLFVYVIMDMGYYTIWLTSTSKLKQFLKDKTPWKILPKPDNKNISLYLYRTDIILDEIFQRIDNIPEEQLKKLIKALL